MTVNLSRYNFVAIFILCPICIQTPVPIFVIREDIVKRKHIKVCRVGRCSILHNCYNRNFTLLHLQDPAICPCPKPDTLVHAFPTNLFKIYFNIILTSTLRTSRRLVSFTFPDQACTHVSSPTYEPHVPSSYFFLT